MGLVDILIINCPSLKWLWLKMLFINSHNRNENLLMPIEKNLWCDAGNEITGWEPDPGSRLCSTAS